MSEKHRHTPEPWSFDEVWSIIRGPKNEEVAAVHPGQGDGERQDRRVAQANGRLLALAPELAEALRGLVDSLESDASLMFEHSVDLEALGHEEACELCKARAVLAKLEA